MGFQKINWLRISLNLIPCPVFNVDNRIVYWKSRLLYYLLWGILVLGTLAYIPSVFLSIKIKLWSVVLADSLVYFFVLFLIFNKKLNGERKATLLLVTFYLLGIALLVFLGPMGAGFNWLFIFPLLAGFFYSFRAVVIASLVNLISFILLCLFFLFPNHTEFLIQQYSLEGWIVNCINFLALTFVLSSLLSLVIYNIDKSLIQQKLLTKRLQKEKEKLHMQKMRAEQADMLKTSFLANMSHEIRTPLNAIMGFSEILCHNNYDEVQKQRYTKLILGAGDQLMALIDDIIDISKIESNNLSIYKRHFKLLPLMDEIIEIHQEKISSLGLNMQIMLYSNIHEEELIYNDDKRLKQVISNLIGNAIKYAKKGEIEISCSYLPNDPDKLLFSVKDSGLGIAKEDLVRIFDRFIQLEQDQFSQGTGIGLSISKGLVSLMGGTIWAESENNTGATFSFTINKN